MNSLAITNHIPSPALPALIADTWASAARRFLECFTVNIRNRNTRASYGRAADIETRLGCHTFRTTGITDYLTNGGRIELAQRMAGHSNAKTTGLYGRRNDHVSVREVERVGI